MSEWSVGFQAVLDKITSAYVFSGSSVQSQRLSGLLHGLIIACQYEDDVLIWLTTVPGDNIFGSQVVFVNGKVLSELIWEFSEWEDGTAPNGVFNEEDRLMIADHLKLKSTAPILARVRKETTNPNQDGANYQFHFHCDLPYSLRLTIAIP